jgi:hypothetical protein
VILCIPPAFLSCGSPDGWHPSPRPFHDFARTAVVRANYILVILGLGFGRGKGADLGFCRTGSGAEG